MSQNVVSSYGVGLVGNMKGYSVRREGGAKAQKQRDEATEATPLEGDAFFSESTRAQESQEMFEQATFFRENT